MTRVSLIIVIIMLLLLSILFFVSGYKTATGLLHAQLPTIPKVERKVSIDTSTLLASQTGNIKLPGPVEENGINLDTLSGFLPKKVGRFPSPRTEAKKKEPLQASIPQSLRKKSPLLNENMEIPYAMDPALYSQGNENMGYATDQAFYSQANENMGYATDQAFYSQANENMGYATDPAFYSQANENMGYATDSAFYSQANENMGYATDPTPYSQGSSYYVLE